MARSLGTLTVDLILKTGQFESDAGRAAKMAERRAKQIDAAFKKAGAAIGVALVAGAGVATVAIKRTIDSMDEMSKAAQKASLPTEDFSKLAYAASLADVEMGSLVTSLGKLARSQGDAARGLKTQVESFEALGVAYKNADGSLRNTREVFLDLADAFAKNADKPETISAGMQLLGRKFQDLIPLIKDGSAGLKDAGIELERFGGVVSTVAGQQAEQFNDNLTRMRQIVGGVSLSFANELLPSLVSASEGVLRFIQSSGGVEQIAKNIGNAMSTAFEVAKAMGVYLGTRYVVSLGLAAKALITTTAATKGLTIATAALEVGLGTLRVAAALLFGPVGLIALGATGLYLLATRQTEAEKAADAHRKAMDLLNGTMNVSLPRAVEMARQLRDEAKGRLDTAKATLAQARAELQLQQAREIPAGPNSADAQAFQGWGASLRFQRQKALVDELQKELGDLDAAFAQAAGKAGVEQAVQFLDSFRAVAEETAKPTKDSAAAMRDLASAEDDLYRKSLATVDANTDAMLSWGDLAAQLQGPTAVALRDHQKRLQEIEVTGKAAGKTADEIRALQDAERARYQAMTPLAQAAQRAAEEFQYSWLNAVDSVGNAFGDWMTGTISSFKDFGRTLVDIAKRWGSDLISKGFARLFNGGFADAGGQGGGGIGGWLANLAGGDGVMGSIARVFGFGGARASAAGAGWGATGVSSLAGGSGFLGMPVGAAGASQFTAAGAAQAAAGGGGLGNLGMLSGLKSGSIGKFLMSPAAPWLGAAAGALYGYNSTDDGLGKGLAAGAYGVAGYGLMTGVGAGLAAYGTAAGASVFTAAGAAASMAGTAGTVGAAGAASAGLAAVPVVGWIALAAIAIDKLSGGKLFGTKYKMESATSNFAYGPGGISGDTDIVKVRQRSLFRGRKWTTETQALSEEARAALADAFGVIQDTVVEAAQKLGVAVPDLLAATFKQEFDKDGKLKSEMGEIAGRKYRESQDAFNQRYLAENLLVVAGLAGHAEAIQQLAGAYRGTGEALTEFATLMLAVAADAKAGALLWADTDEALGDAVAALEHFRKAGEQLADTYARLRQATTDYANLIAGVRRELATRDLSDYAKAQLDVELQYRAQVKQANELAKALGLSGARAEDLAAIEQLRAVRMADLQRQMEQQRDQFLGQLGLSELGPGTDATKLQDAIGLLRKAVDAGDLQQAQQLAQQALGFGRSLYASGSDYNALYGQVTGMLGGLDPSKAGLTADALQQLADTMETLPNDIAAALWQVMQGQVANNPPPPTLAPPAPERPGRGPGITDPGFGRDDRATSLLATVADNTAELVRRAQSDELRRNNARRPA